jgi:hypothetical protein
LELLKTTLDNSISLTDDDITFAQLKVLTMLYNKMPVSALSVSSNHDTNIKYSSTIKERLIKKRKLCKLLQINRLSVLKTKLKQTIKALKNLLDLKRNQTIQEYISKLSVITAINSLYKKPLRD